MGKHEEACFNLSMSFAFYFGKPLHPGKETCEIVPLALRQTKIGSSQSKIQNGKLYVELIS